MPRKSPKLFFAVGLLLSLLPACKQPGPVNLDHPAYADSLIERAGRLFRNGQRSSYLRYLDSVYHYFPQAGPGDRWKKYKELADYYLVYVGDTLRARRYTDSMRAAIAGQTDLYQQFYSETIFAEGDLQLARHRYQAAFDRYYQGYLFAREHLDSCSLSLFNSKLGLVKYRQGNYTEAIPYTRQALRERQHCRGSEYLSQSFLNTIALCYEHTGQPDSAIANYRRALQLLPKSSTDSSYVQAARGVIYGNLGGLYAQRCDDTRAEHYLVQSIALNNRPGYETGDAVTAELKLAALYLKEKRAAAADSVLRHTAADLRWQQALHHDVASWRIRWQQLQWQYLDQSGRGAAAYAALKRYDQLRDSLDAVNKGLQTADMDAAFKTNEQQQRLLLLARDNRLKTISLGSILVFALLTTGICVLVITGLRRSRRQNNRLEQAMDALEKNRRELFEKNQFLQGLLDNLPVILYQIGPDGRIASSSGAGLKAVPGWSNDQLVGVDAFSLATDMTDAFRRAMAGECVRALNTFQLYGEAYYFDTIVLPDSTRTGGIIGFAVDVTAAKKAETAVQLQAARLERLNIFKDKLLSVISHDLRQPFSSILMATEVLQLAGSAVSREELETIMLGLADTATQSIGLLEGLLAWVRSEKADFSYQPQPIRLHANVAEAAGLYRYSQQQHRIILLNEVPHGLTIMAHHQMLLFIHRNLIGNASKYSPQGGTVTVSAVLHGPELIVTVSDQGPGMTDSQLARLFSVREEPNESHLQGAGIALSICYDMIRQMNGRIWAESQPGHGTQFRYALPTGS